jgi:hypothetical protein
MTMLDSKGQNSGGGSDINDAWDNAGGASSSSRSSGNRSRGNEPDDGGQDLEDIPF